MHNSYRVDDLTIQSERGMIIALEAKRIAERYNKDFLDCEDLKKIIGVGKNNIRDLMKSEDFPTIEIGNRKVVSVTAFAAWAFESGNSN